MEVHIKSYIVINRAAETRQYAIDVVLLSVLQVLLRF